MSGSGESSNRADKGPLRLTARGRHAVRFGTLTPPRWWNALVKEADNLNEQDEELGLSMLDERIAGMQALRADWYRIINNADDSDSAVSSEPPTPSDGPIRPDRNTHS